MKGEKAENCRNTMKKCNSCSSIIDDKEVFCPKCGSKRFTPIDEPKPVELEEEKEEEEDSVDFAVEDEEEDEEEEEAHKKGKKKKKEKPPKKEKVKKEAKPKKEKKAKQPKLKPEGPPPEGPATMGEYLKFLLWAFLPLAGPIVLLVKSIKAAGASEWMNPSLVNLGKAGIVYSIILLLIEIGLTVGTVMLFMFYIML